MRTSITVFVSYAHEDEELCQRLNRHLSLLKQENVIDIWYDQIISAGTDWEIETKKYLETAQIILLLVSPDFLASKHLYSVEMTRALEKHHSQDACVIPIILRPVDWKSAPFATLQALPHSGVPVTSWPNSDDAFLDITNGIREAVKKLLRPEDLTTPQRTSQQWLDIGDGFYERSYYEGALDAYQHAIQLNIVDAIAHNKKGMALCNLKRFQDALEAHKQATYLHPDYALAYYNIGNVLLTLGRHEEALSAYKQAMRLEPQLTETYLGRGETYSALNRLEEALEAYNTASILTPDEAFYTYKKAETLLMLGRHKEALIACEQATQFNSNEPLYHYKKAEILLVLHQKKEALSACDQALHLDPDEALYHYKQAEVLLKLNFTHEGLTTYQAALEKDATQVGEKYHFTLLKRFGGGIAAHEQPLFAAMAHQSRGNACMALGRHEEALAAYEQFTNIHPYSAYAFLGKGNVYLTMHRYADALSAYNKVIALNPLLADAYIGKGRTISEKAEAGQRTQEEVSGTVTFIGTNLLSYVTSRRSNMPFGLFRTYNRDQFQGVSLPITKQLKETLAAYEHAISLNPDNARYYYYKGDPLQLLKRYDEALEAYKKATMLDPSNATYYLYQGQVLQTLTRDEEALSAYEQALSLNPDNAPALAKRTEVLSKLGR